MFDFPLCLNTSTIRPTPLLEKIKVASLAGFASVELWFDDVIAYNEAGGRTADVVRALADAGLTVPSMIALRDWSGTEGAEQAAAIDEAKRRLALAAELGSPSVVATPTAGREPVPETARRFAELLDLGRAHGVKPAFEFIGRFDQYKTIDESLKVTEACGKPDTTIVVDAFHIFRGGGEMTDLRRIPGDRMSIAHIDDAPTHLPREEQHDRDRVMPGDGLIDLKLFLNLLDEQGYRGPLSLELFNETYWARDPLETAREGIAKLRAVVSS